MRGAADPRRAAHRRRRDGCRHRRAHGRHRRAPRARRPAQLRDRRQAGRGPAARGRHHGEPQRGAVRPAPADGHSGLRIGTPALATRGFGDAEFTEVADIIALALHAATPTSRRSRARVEALTAAFPLYPGLHAVGDVRMTAITLDGIATASADQGASSPRGSRRCAARGVVPGLGTLLVGDDPGSRAYVGRQAPRLRRGRHRVDPRRPAGRRDRRPRCARRSRELNSARDVHRLHRAAAAAGGPSTRTRCSSSSTPTRTPTACTRRTSAGSCSASRASCTRRCRARRPASSSCCGGTTCRSAGKHVVVIGRGLTVGPPARAAAHPQGHRRDGHADALAHAGPRGRGASRRHRRRGGGRAAPRAARLDQAGRGRARRRRHARRRTRRPARRRLTGDVDPGVAEVAGWLSPNPGGVGPMTRAMLLANVVEAAEQRLHR